jgi:two-component system heavy metal sensor histidine kinase CusS
MSSSEAPLRETPVPPGWSLAGRLTLWYAASAFVLVALSTGALYWVLVRNAQRQDDQFLVDTVQIVRALIRERPDDLAALHQEVEWEGAARRYARIYVRITEADGRIVAETPGTRAIIEGHSLQAAGVDAEPGPRINLTSAAGTPYRAVAAWAPVGPDGTTRRLVQAVLDQTAEQALLRMYRTRLWGVLGLALCAAGAVGHLIARRGMRPVESIAETARGVRSSTLASRIPVSGLPAELSGLAETFNQMLTRLEDAFTRLQGFSADLAHELRTPINNLRGEVEVALGKPRDAAAYRETLESVLEECGRLSQMIDGLMFLARADSPETRIELTPIDAKRELRTVADLYEPAAAEAGVDIAIEAGSEDPLVAAVDRTLFQRALSNLITNALTHTPAGGRVRVSAHHVDQELQIEVTDTGAGIPAPHLARLTDRFYRVDPSRSSASGGLGLGLAIVQSIMKVHGGSCAIASEEGRGTSVRLAFPTADLREDAVGHMRR